MDGLVVRAAQYVKNVRKSNGSQVELLGHILRFARPEIEAAERKAFQDCTAIIKKKLSDLISKRETLANAYNEMMADIPNCPNQFNSPEYKVVDRQCELLYEILRRIEEESK